MSGVSWQRPWRRFIGPYADALFGDGSDGNVTISSIVGLTRDMYYQDLSITSSGTLYNLGYRIFVRGTLTMVSGSVIDNSGYDGDPDGAYTTAMSVGTLGSAGDGAGSTGNGGTASNGLGGYGGDGGDGELNTWGSGGSSSLANTSGGLLYGYSFPQVIRGGTVIKTGRLYGGGGGGGGSDNALGDPGAGGGTGGGPILVCARQIVFPSGASFRAWGGNGGDANYDDVGGGGGGGGGLIILVTLTPEASLSGTFNVDAGGGGAGGGGLGVSGSAGTAGLVYLLCGE